MTERPDKSLELARAEARLAELDAERARLQAQIEALRRPTPAPAGAAPAISVVVPAASGVVVPATHVQKVALFAALFRGRTDVYPRRWENARTGKSGYSPHCANEWKRGVCEKPKVKCGECPVKAFVPVTDRVLYDHLQGEIVAGGGTPRVVTCAEETEDHVILPRGCLQDLEDLASAYRIPVAVRDERVRGTPLDVQFQGTLSTEQERAVRALAAHEIGVLVAPPGMGKTVLAAHLIVAPPLATSWCFTEA